MKKYWMLMIFLFPLVAEAQENPTGNSLDQPYAWRLTGFGGAASLCDEQGCFGPTGYNFGASFGRNMTNRWSFELEGTYTSATQTLAARVDPLTGIVYNPELNTGRFWGGAVFFARLATIGKSSEFFIAMGGVVGYEQLKEKAPEGVFVPPTQHFGLTGGVTGGAGFNFWFSKNWGLRPEVRFYGVAENLSGVRYTGGIIRKF
jgi:hypothetical protein